ncbi:hypothetical protein [Halostagnicola sp. A56]|uniref:hypothetical protein n=1 Tax=Halostagnicola sp. A56 TaxID=1495067 RepID=UPI0012E100B9|nr:hypothetical protein [Halostagnicola sp. A56]
MEVFVDSHNGIPEAIEFLWISGERTENGRISVFGSPFEGVLYFEMRTGANVTDPDQQMEIETSNNETLTGGLILSDTDNVPRIHADNPTPLGDSDGDVSLYETEHRGSMVTSDGTVEIQFEDTSGYETSEIDVQVTNADSDDVSVSHEDNIITAEVDEEDLQGDDFVTFQTVVETENSSETSGTYVQFSDEMFSTFEYVVFKILGEETNIVDGPYLPMLRSEIQFSKRGFENDNLELTLLRQSAFFETYCRMKLERSRQTEWRHLDIESVDILGSEDICQLEKIRDLRGDYAHDWRVYLGQDDDVQLRNMCSNGLGVLARLHKRELVKAYEDNCSQHISQRYPSEWSDRATATLEANATATLAITCENCSHQFVPEEEDLRYCPQCGIPHDYLSRSHQD